MSKLKDVPYTQVIICPLADHQWASNIAEKTYQRPASGTPVAKARGMPLSGKIGGLRVRY